MADCRLWPAIHGCPTAAVAPVWRWQASPHAEAADGDEDEDEQEMRDDGVSFQQF